jgi:hypothetical protein
MVDNEQTRTARENEQTLRRDERKMSEEDEADDVSIGV